MDTVKKSKDFLSQGIDVSQRDIRVLVIIRQGNLLKDQNRIDEALNYYNQIIDINGEQAVAYYNRGALIKKFNRKNEALQNYNQGISLNPDYDNAYIKRGNLLKELNRKKEALSDYNKAIEINSQNAQLQRSRGNIKKLSNRIEEALADYNQAIEINHQDAKPYMSRRNGLLMLLNRKEEVFADFNEPSIKNAKNPDEFHNRAAFYINRCQYDDAIACYQKALINFHNIEEAETKQQQLNAQNPYWKLKIISFFILYYFHSINYYSQIMFIQSRKHK